MNAINDATSSSTLPKEEVEEEAQTVKVSQSCIELPYVPNNRVEPNEQKCEKSFEEETKTTCTCRGNFERLRAKVKKGYSFKVPKAAPLVRTGPRLSLMSNFMESVVKSRVSESGLEEFADYSQKFETLYELGDTIGEVIFFK